MDKKKSWFQKRFKLLDETVHCTMYMYIKLSIQSLETLQLNFKDQASSNLKDLETFSIQYSSSKICEQLFLSSGPLAHFSAVQASKYVFID